MRILILTCNRYSDAWGPFFEFFQRHWPDCPYPVDIATDLEPDMASVDLRCWPGWNGPYNHNIFYAGRVGWNRVLKDYLDRHIKHHGDEPILLLLEDYFLTRTPNLLLIEEAKLILRLGMSGARNEQPGCVRLYPCPGGDIEVGNPNYALVSPASRYRTSTQASIWSPHFMRQIATLTRSPWDFEISGSKISRAMNNPIYAFKREVKPWPIEYICTAIVRGKWQQSALDYCAREGVEVDTSKRAIRQDGL